ncbi:unnamed protein product [Ceutorhynchus assimilis]|uniref:Chitinase domain-containing protein 1 n=1 Tax=Ceutorhynchus assimilis TaxID=467358 RepID=A0A9N9MZZ3_9CUCU|nr:unnamed protein product [Ceutorhynchus assimilis]
MIFSKTRLIFILICALAYEISASQTLSPKNKGTKKKSAEKTDKKPSKERLGPQKYSVFDKNFVSQEVTAKDIVNNHRAFFTETDEYNFDGLVLGYVTPWNNHGYDIGKIFGNKFTHISPVWLQVRRKGPKKYEVTGTHDIDKQWVVDVRNAGRERKTKIVPRVLFDGWTGKDYTELFNNPKERLSLSKTLIESCKKHKFDGFVIEVWSQIAGAVNPDSLVELIRDISDLFTVEGLDFILVVPPKRNADLFTSKQFDALYDYVTAFSLMTYDFADPTRPGPNAPINWIEDTISAISLNETRRKKILMGLNFYGNDYTANGGGPIVGHEYIKILEQFPELSFTYVDKVAEHLFEYKDKDGINHLVFYPTLYSILQRLELAHKLKVGVSIWEIGQGLDYFYDLL